MTKPSTQVKPTPVPIPQETRNVRVSLEHDQSNKTSNSKTDDIRRTRLVFDSAENMKNRNE